MANELKYKGFTGSVECSIEDDCLHGKILFVDDLITYEGETVVEIKTAFKAAVDHYLAYCEKTGRAANKPFSGSFNVRIGPELHRQAAECARRAGTKLNEFVANAVKQAVEISCGIHINHHHEHCVTVTLQRESTQLLDLVSSTDKRPSNWQSVPYGKLN